MMDRLSVLKLWCLGYGIIPSVIDHPELVAAVERKDPAGALAALKAHATSFDVLADPLADPLADLTDEAEAEFTMIVNDDEAGLKFMAAAYLEKHKDA